MMSNEDARTTVAQITPMEYSASTGNSSGNTSTWDSAGFVNPLTGNIHLQVIFTASYIIVFAACFFGNLAVLIVILRNPSMRTRTNFFLANLAVADFCVSIFCIFPNMAIFYSPNWLLGKAMCKLYYFVNQMSYTTSITLLTVISLERYIAIMYPLKAPRLITLRRLKVSLFLVWILSGLYNSPQFAIFDTIEFVNKTFCFYSGAHEDKLLYRWYHLCNFILFYATPLVLMSFVYTRISLVLWRSSAAGSADDGWRESHHTRYCSVSTPSHAPKAKTVVNKHGRVSLVFGKRRNTNNANQSPSSNNVRLDYHSENTERESISSFDKDRVECMELTRLNSSPCRSKNSANSTPTHYHASSPGRIRSPRVQRYTNSSPFTSRSQRAPQTSFTSSQTEPRVNAMVARRKVIRLLVAVVVSFAVCVLPYHVLILLEDWAYKKYIPSVYPPISYLILYLNSGLNPILYALLSDKFRRSLRDTLCCKKS